MRCVETMSISEFKAKCLAVIARVEKTRMPLLITKRGKPMATINPAPKDDRENSWLGCMADTV